MRGIGNSRGEITRDPADPVIQAENLGRTIFTTSYTDYRVDTARAGKVWPVAEMGAPSIAPPHDL